MVVVGQKLSLDTSQKIHDIYLSRRYIKNCWKQKHAVFHLIYILQNFYVELPLNYILRTLLVLLNNFAARFWCFQKWLGFRTCSEHVSKDWYLLNKIFYLTFDTKPPRPLAEYDALLSISFSSVVSYLAGPGLSL